MVLWQCVLSILKGCVLIAFWLQLLKTMFVLESNMAGDLKLYGTIRHRVSKAINSHDGKKKKHDWFKNSLNYPLRQKKAFVFRVCPGGTPAFCLRLSNKCHQNSDQSQTGRYALKNGLQSLS